MKGVPQGRYTREFRQEAVKLVTEERLSLPEAARRLSLAPSTLGYWVKAQRAGKLGDVGKTYRPLTEVEMDLARTKKELAEVKMERDILTDIPQIEPPFLDIAPAGMLPTIISHSKGVKCVLIRSNSSFHGPTTVLPSVKSPNRLSTTKSLPWEALLPCTTR